MTSKLRLVVFTAGIPTPVDRVMYERLGNDPRLDLAAIIVDEYQPKRKPLVQRVVRALREDGPACVAFKLRAKLRGMIGNATLRILDWIHGPSAEQTQLDIPIHRVADIHSEESLTLIRSLAPDLGIIVGGRILRESVITIPTLGTLNIHKRKLPEYRGGGPVGYWEILGGESSIGVSIHYAIPQVDAGPVVAEATIAIEEFDTLESLKIKADLRGAELYHQAVREIAEGKRQGIAQDLSRGKTYRAPSEYKVWQLERCLTAKSAAPHSWLVRARVGLQYLALLPRLRQMKRDLIRANRAPISIFFYHLVADRALNHMRLPLTTFVRQIEFIGRYFPVLSLDEAVARLRSGSNSEIAASITFDDGYRDNAWAIEYLRYFRIPATFFVSIGHVRKQTSFEHDLRRGYEHALPMSEGEVRRLAEDGFTVGSHGIDHEDFGTLTAIEADHILRASREEIEETCGTTPIHFAFPKGQRGTNITPETFALALEHYSFIFSAYGGYAYPDQNRRHFVRMSNPSDTFEMSLAMTGYTGFRECLRGNAWGLETDKLNPCTKNLKIALIASSPSMVGGHSVQAQTLANDLRSAGHEVSFIPIDARLPQWLRRIPGLRTLANEALYIASLANIRTADVVHVFSASYWSFLLAPAPAILAAKLLGKKVILHYHSGEAEDHLRRWRRVVAPFLRLADSIVVPSAYLQSIFEAHGFRAQVIPNVVDTNEFPYRERAALSPRLLSVRNLEPYYRIDNTISAFEKIKSRFPDATLTIAGYGSRENELRMLARGVDGIRFLGRVERNALPAVYDEADLFVNSSVVDNQPVSILEAFAAGLPVVSTATGDIAAMLRHGEAGFLVNADDPSSMADAVTRALEDRELSLKISRRAHEEVERHSSLRVREQWNALYTGVLASGV